MSIDYKWRRLWMWTADCRNQSIVVGWSISLVSTAQHYNSLPSALRILQATATENYLHKSSSNSLFRLYKNLKYYTLFADTGFGFLKCIKTESSAVSIIKQTANQVKFTKSILTILFYFRWQTDDCELFNTNSPIA